MIINEVNKTDDFQTNKFNDVHYITYIHLYTIAIFIMFNIYMIRNAGEYLSKLKSIQTQIKPLLNHILTPVGRFTLFIEGQISGWFLWSVRRLAFALVLMNRCTNRRAPSVKVQMG